MIPLKKLSLFSKDNNKLEAEKRYGIDKQTDDEVDKIFLFEDLQNLEQEFDLNLSHENKKQKYLNYRDYYDQETTDYIYNLDKYIINKFSYDF